MASLFGSILRVLQQLLCASTSQQDAQQQQPAPTHPQHAHAPQQPAPHGHPQQTPHSPESHAPKPHAPSHHEPSHKPYRNENLINQNDAHYKQLRARAHAAGDAMGRCFDESHRAYEAGDGARAKALSEEGHAHQREMNELNAQASDWIFHANNTDSKAGEIDLHGLFVREAITHTERAIQEAQSRGDSEIHLIVGKGLHSTEHVAKVKPAIEDLVQKYNLSAHLDEHNAGVLIVALDGRRSERALGPEDITRRLEREDQECVVM